MTIKIGINGLGRIGRCVVRAWAEYAREDIEIVAINAPAPAKRHGHLLRYDSVHGPFPGTVERTEDTLTISGNEIKLLKHKNPAEIPWGDHGVDIVLECTGIFRSKEDAGKHLIGGAKKVLVSAPSPDPDATIVYGVNNDVLKAEDQIISVGSCTTNCLAPVAKVLNDEFGIETGFMTTIHAYTGDQNLLDGTHKDLRRARAAGLSMIPTSTGAASALSLVVPELAGKLDGTAVRVPTPNVSMVDLVFNSQKDLSVDLVNDAIKAASEGDMKGVLGINDEELVSTDFNHNPNSSIFDLTQTYIVGDKLCRVVSWYDNEWGFSCRMLDVAALAKSLS
jgi:glyceraldehyde 3-phosphate dehydrogenase